MFGVHVRSPEFRTGAAAAADAAESAGVLTERSGRIVAAHRLLRRARRTETGEFLAEGAQAVSEAVDAARDRPALVRELFVTEAAAGRHRDVVRAAYAAGIPVSQVTDKGATALSDTTTPQGLIAWCRSPLVDAEQVLGRPLRLVVVLVETGDPGNAGSIIRLADAAGADAVLFAGDAVDPLNPKAVRASTGSLFHLPVAQLPVEALAERLSGAGLTTLATSGAAEYDLDDVAEQGLLDAPTAWLFGSEAHGLPAPVLAAADLPVRIPIHGRAESLNLATAAAVCLYASARAQRRG